MPPVAHSADQHQLPAAVSNALIEPKIVHADADAKNWAGVGKRATTMPSNASTRGDPRAWSLYLQALLFSRADIVAPRAAVGQIWRRAPGCSDLRASRRSSTDTAYRIEYDARSGAHINVQAADGTKGPHISSKATRKLWTSLFVDCFAVEKVMVRVRQS